MTRARLRLVTGIAIAWGSACASPTVTLQTEKPIEIKIDLYHEVRVRVDREVDEMIQAEENPPVTSRSTAPADDELVRAAKQRGAVGEQANGYLGLRAQNPHPIDRALVNRLNARRHTEYLDLAKETGAPIAELEKAAGANRIDEADPGEWVQTPDGPWIRVTDATEVVVHDQPDNAKR